MTHPNPNVIYCHSYPRSGSNWFKYCFEFITKTKSMPRELNHESWMKSNKADYPQRLYHTHVPSTYHFEKNSQIALPSPWTKNVTLVRNYKEAIISNTLNWVIKLKDDTTLRCLITPDHLDPSIPNWLAGRLEKVTDFIPGAPRTRDTKKCEFYRSEIPQVINSLEEVVMSNAVIHEIFISEMIQYYFCLEFHYKTETLYPQNALIIYYEDFVKNPYKSLNSFIDFLERHNLPLLNNTSMFRKNLDELMNNLDFHRTVCINQYRTATWNPAVSYKHKTRDINLEHHSSKENKDFLKQIDKIMMNSKLFDSVLFDTYLSRYKTPEDD